MTAATGRRALLRRAACAALLPLAAQTPMRLQAGAPPAFAPPSGPMRYSRTLTRQLADGLLFTVARDFAVAFRPHGDGYRVEGRQVAVTVEAPPALAALAQLERRRIDQSVFPLILDHEGLIASGPELDQGGMLEVAIRLAQAQIDNASAVVALEGDPRPFLLTLQEAAANLSTALPRDLFAPRVPARSDRAPVALPDGEQGEVSVSFEARADPRTGLLMGAERRVITTVAADRRETIERWELAPL